jgi:glycine cleavage system H protein
MKKFTNDHEWIMVHGDIVTVGITDHAQHQLGDLVYVDLPDVGSIFVKGATAATVESVKAASDIYSPLSGEVVEVNQKLGSEPELVNQSPMDEGWFFKIRISRQDEIENLLDEAAYATLIAGA